MGRAKKILLDSYPELRLQETSVCRQVVGIRPNSHDRLPYIGSFAEQSRIYMLNGLGGKGSILAPWCAKLLCDHIVDGCDIPKAVSLARIFV